MKGLKKEFESSTVNEPSVFEPLGLYCFLTCSKYSSSGYLSMDFKIV